MFICSQCLIPITTFVSQQKRPVAYSGGTTHLKKKLFGWVCPGDLFECSFRRLMYQPFATVLHWLTRLHHTYKPHHKSNHSLCVYVTVIQFIFTGILIYVQIVTTRSGYIPQLSTLTISIILFFVFARQIATLYTFNTLFYSG